MPNEREFYAKYHRVPRNALPKTVTIRRTYVRKIGPRKQQEQKNQTGHRMPTQDLIATAIGLRKKSAKSNLGKMIIKDAINYVPTGYKKLKNKIKNKKVRAVLDTVVGTIL